MIEKVRGINIKVIFSTAFISVLLCLFFSPKWNAFGGSGEISGYTYKIMNYILSYSYLVFMSIEILLAFSGLLIFIIFFRMSFVKMEYKYLILLSGASLLILDIFSERYLIHIFILMIIPLFIIMKSKITKIILSSWICIQGVVFYWYWIVR